MTVVLDTNALMMPVECDVRVFDELERLCGTVEPIVPEAVVAELERLAASGNGEEATAASVGRDLLDRCAVRETAAGSDTEAGADDAVLELASEGEDVDLAVTNDAALRKRLLDAGVPVASLHTRNKLAITQP